VARMRDPLLFVNVLTCPDCDEMRWCVLQAHLIPLPPSRPRNYPCAVFSMV